MAAAAKNMIFAKFAKCQPRIIRIGTGFTIAIAEIAAKFAMIDRLTFNFYLLTTHDNTDTDDISDINGLLATTTSPT